MSDSEDKDVQPQSDASESEELAQPEQNEENKAHEDVPIPQNEVQQSVQIHSDRDLFSNPSFDNADDGGLDDEDTDEDAEEHEDDVMNSSTFSLPMAHKRGESMTEKRESIQQQKAAMEAKLRTLSQNLEVSGQLNEFQEMEQIHDDKHIFGDLFDKIDPDDNGDVDEREFIGGLSRLGVQIVESDMGKLFKLMDGDKSGYIDRQDWVTFCMTTYQSPELQRLHDSVLLSVKGHSRKPSNMFHPQDSTQWSASAITNLEKQMTAAFLAVGADEVQKAEEEEEYIATMEKEAATNPLWAKPERALEWSPKEVAFWLDTIELGQYARKFDAEQVDGSILLNDCDKNLLQREMAIKPLHVGKILREVDKLRKLNKDELTESYRDWNELINENEILLQVINDKDAQIKDLQTENAELRLKTINCNIQNIEQFEQTALGTEETQEKEQETPETKETNDDDMDPYIQIKILNEEIDFLHKQKITFAENASDEIVNLNRIIKVLSREYTHLSTPYYKKLNGFNPLDSIIRSLGYLPPPR